MITVLLVIHILIAAALIGFVLVQRSEGGALGMGGGGFMTGRGQANFLTRTTAYLAVAFFATSIALTIVANQQRRPTSVFDNLPSKSAPATPAAPGTPSAPTPTAPAAPATPAPAPEAPARGGILDKLNKN